MTLVNLGNFSGITDGANASPSYLNSKFSQLLSMVTAVNSAGTDFGASSGSVNFGTLGRGVLGYNPAVLYAQDYAGANWGIKVQAALDALPSSGGIVDASFLTGRQEMTSHVTLNSYQRLLLGDAQVSMNANSIVVVSGSTGAAIVGKGPWGLDGAAGAAANGSSFSYSGQSIAFLVGSAAKPTAMTEITDVGVQFSSTTSAMGFRFNRALLWKLSRPRISGSNSSTSLYGIVLDGTSGYVGHGLLEQPWISNGYRGIWLTGSGVNAPNSNVFVGGSISGSTWGDGLVLDAAGENTFSGMDFENWATGLKLAAAADNNTFSQVRLESNTTDFDIAAGASFNKLFVASLSASSWVDAGTLSTIWGGVNIALKPDQFLMRNQADAQASWVLQAGSTTPQARTFRFRNGSTGTDSYTVGATNSDTFSIVHGPSGVAQMTALAANLQVNPLGTGGVQFSTASGSGGAGFYDGNNNLGASITSNGFASFGTGSAIQPGIRFTSEQSLGLYKSGDSTIAMSYGTFNLASNSIRLSVRTVAAASLDSTTMAVNEVAFSVAGASGASLAIRSGSTIYYFSSSLSTKA